MYIYIYIYVYICIYVQEEPVALTAVGRVCMGNGTATSSIVLNPHWRGEAAVFDSEGQVDFFFKS